MTANNSNRSRIVEEQVWCHQMRIRGFTMREISERSADECPIGRHMSLATVANRINAELAAKPAASAAQLRDLELSKLDDYERKLREVIERKHYKWQAGDVVRDSETGEALTDDAPIMSAVRELNRISERRAKLLGIEAPQQIVSDATIRYEIVGVDLDKL